MNIKFVGFTSVLMEFEKISVLTDPVYTSKAGVKIPGDLNADIVIFTGSENYGEEGILEKNDLKIKPATRDSIVEISSMGEYEIGGVIVRRPVGSNFYLIDEGYIRVLYLGQVGNDIDLTKLKNVGDVDVLLLPVGGSGMFPDYERVEKIISAVDPSYLVPYGYKEDALGADYQDLKSFDDFAKQFGLTNIEEMKKFKLTGTPESEQRNMTVVKLER